MKYSKGIWKNLLAEGAEIFMGWKKGTASRRAVVKLMSLTARLLEFKSYLYQVP